MNPTEMAVVCECLQMMYQLFLTAVEPTDEAVDLVMQRSRDGIKAAGRDPYTAFNNRVQEIRYGKSVFYEVGTPPRWIGFYFMILVVMTWLRSILVWATCTQVKKPANHVLCGG